MGTIIKLFKNISKPSAESLGTEPVKDLLLSMAVPSIIAMLMQAFYNTVDSMFVAKISEGSFAAVTLAYPVQMIIGALSTGVGVGINSSISRHLGAGDKSTAARAAANGIMLGIGAQIIMILFGLFGAGPFIRMYSTDPEVIAAGTTYVRTISILALGNIFTQISFSVLQGSGNMLVPMVSQLAGGACVLLFDPILIFGFGLGVLGAAIASSLSQVVAMLIGFYGIFKVNHDNLPVSFKGFRPDAEIIKDILSVGIPSALTQATTSVVSGIINKLIAGYGTAAISVYGGFSKFSSFGILPIFGVTRGMNPILGYSAGAKNSSRFIETRNLAYKYASVFSVITGLVFLIAPGLILHFLSATPEMQEIGPTAYRILGAPLCLYGVSIVSTQIFPPAKMSYITMICTMLRQVGYMIPLCMLFSKIWGLTGVWAGYAAADVINFFVVIAVNIWFRKKILSKWDSKEDTVTEVSEKGDRK